MSINYGFKFTDAAIEAIPELAHIERLNLPDFKGTPVHWHKGDIVRMQGIPSDRPLALLGRIWHATADESDLCLVLGLPEEPYQEALKELGLDK